MTRGTRRIWIAGAGIAVIAAGLSALVALHPGRPPALPSPSQKASPRVVRLASAKGAFYLPLIVAHDQKFFQAQGLTSELLVFNNTNDLVNAFLRGDAETAALGSGGVFALESASPGRVRLVYGQENKSYSLIVPTGSAISKLEDLRGKRIVTWPSPTPKVFLRLILEPRIGKEGYSVTQIDHALQLQALIRGDADALFIQDVYARQAVESGKGRVLSALPLEEFVAKPFFNGGGLIRSETAARDPDLAGAIRRSFNEAVRFIREHESEARRSLVDHLGVSEEVAQHAAIDRFVTVEEIDWPGAQKVADLLREQGIFDKPVKAEALKP